ncbi:MAG: hypothetical protein F4218_11155 [Synechococcus sp. SB0677_bin_5]|nr:hypothetical protein [Synechococcus sp. SB0677_bin_5]
MGRKVERLLARRKDWHPIATRYDRCGSSFRTAILLADNVVVRLWVLTLALHTVARCAWGRASSWRFC